MLDHAMNSLLDAVEYLQQGGWVMIPLAITSVIMWMMILERILVYARFGRSELDSSTVLAIARNENKGVRRQGLRGELLRRFMIARFGDPEVDRHVLRQQQEVMRRHLRQRLAMIAVLASVAPLLGLLGTVLGMIESFEVISIFGTGNAKALAGGISMAMVTTQAGLVIAVPGLFISGWLMRKARTLEHSLDEFVQQIDRPLRGLEKGMAAS